MVSIHSRWLWGTGVAVLLLLALTGITVFALRSQPQTAAAEPRSQPIPTWTNTPQAGATADPGAAVVITGTAGGLSTPTPSTSASSSVSPANGTTDVAAASLDTDTVNSDNGATTGEATTTVSLPAAPAPPVEDESPQGILAQGMLLHRYGDYANARTLYARLLDDANVDGALKREARYDLARAYLGEGLYGEALATLDDLDGELTGAGADPNQFAKKEQFLRGEALLGQGSYSDAIAAYWRFLDAYPWMGESVQPRIAALLQEPWLTPRSGSCKSPVSAYRRSASGNRSALLAIRLLMRHGRRFYGKSTFMDLSAFSQCRCGFYQKVVRCNPAQIR